MVFFSKKYQSQIFPKFLKLSFWIPNITKVCWKVYDTNPNNLKFTWWPPNTEVFKVFSVSDWKKWPPLSTTPSVSTILQLWKFLNVLLWDFPQIKTLECRNLQNPVTVGPVVYGQFQFNVKNKNSKELKKRPELTL